MTYRDRLLPRSRDVRVSDVPAASRRGFNLLEVIFVIAVLGILAAISYTMYLNMLPRLRLEQASQEATTFLRQARQAAIRQATTMVVTVDEETESAAVTPRNPRGIVEQYLVLNRRRADGTLDPQRSFLVSRARSGIFVRGPDSSDLIGFNGFTFPSGELTIRSDGTVASIGGLRISDDRGEGGETDPRNVMQVTYPTRAGAPVIEKWLTSADAPSGDPAGFYRQRYASSSNKALWQWY